MNAIKYPAPYLRDVILVALVTGIIFVMSLGGRPYSAPSESRYVEIGREMNESGDYVTPRLNYVKYFEKPPLFYWMQSANTALFGTGFFVSRLPTVLFSVALCLITYWLGLTLYDRRTALFSALAFSTAALPFVLSRIVLLDVPVSAFMAGTLTAFLYALKTPASKKREIAIYAMYVFAACAVLTKGLIGIVLPGMVVASWLLCTGNWKVLRELHLIKGSLLFLLIAAPWHVLVAMRNPEFLQFYFVHEHFQRYLTKVHGRYQPPWYFLPIVAGGLFPWVMFIAQAAKQNLGGMWKHRQLSHGTPLFLALWIGIIFLFFSLSDSKLAPYILPIFPPLSVLLGHYLAGIWNGARPKKGFRFGVYATIILLSVLAVTLSLIHHFTGANSKIGVALATAGSDIKPIAVALLIAAGILFYVIRNETNRAAIVTLAVISVLFLQMADNVMRHYTKDSMKRFSHIIRDEDTPSEVAMYRLYYQDMPVYLHKRITLVDWKGELSFGTEHEDTSAWMIDEAELWKRWNTKGHLMFLVVRKEDYPGLQSKSSEGVNFYTAAEEGKNLLLSNSDIFAY